MEKNDTRVLDSVLEGLKDKKDSFCVTGTEIIEFIEVHGSSATKGSLSKLLFECNVSSLRGEIFNISRGWRVPSHRRWASEFRHIIQCWYGGLYEGRTRQHKVDFFTVGRGTPYINRSSFYDMTQRKVFLEVLCGLLEYDNTTIDYEAFLYKWITSLVTKPTRLKATGIYADGTFALSMTHEPNRVDSFILGSENTGWLVTLHIIDEVSGNKGKHHVQNKEMADEIAVEYL